MDGWIDISSDVGHGDAAEGVLLEHLDVSFGNQVPYSEEKSLVLKGNGGKSLIMKGDPLFYKGNTLFYKARG